METALATRIVGAIADVKFEELTEHKRLVKAQHGVFFNDMLLEKILGYMSDEKDLYRSRRVCKLWSQSGMRVLVNGGYKYGQGVQSILNSNRFPEFYNDMMAAETFPFRSFHICLSSKLEGYSHNENPSVSQIPTSYDFFSEFGTHVKELSIVGVVQNEDRNDIATPLLPYVDTMECIQKLKHILQNVPNLRMLSLSGMHHGLTNQPFVIPNKNIMSKMKTLLIQEVHTPVVIGGRYSFWWNYSSGFLNELLQIIPGVTELSLRAHTYLGMQNFRTVIQQLPGLNTLELQFLGTNRFIDNLVQHERKFSNLKVTVSRFGPVQAETFQTFLAGQCETLNELSFVVDFRYTPDIMELPNVPTLKYLARLDVAFVNACYDFTNRNNLVIHPIQIYQLPNLEAISANIWFFKKAFSQGRLTPFYGVKTLSIQFENYLEVDPVVESEDMELVAAVFPNVRKLNAFQIMEEGLRSVFKHMLQLNHLNLSYAGKTNINLVLCGLTDASMEHLNSILNYCSVNNAASYPAWRLPDLVEFYAKKEAHPSLRRLQQLKHLGIWEKTGICLPYERAKEILDVSIYLALLKIPPLEQLQLPSYCKELRSIELLHEFHGRLVYY